LPPGSQWPAFGYRTPVIAFCHRSLRGGTPQPDGLSSGRSRMNVMDIFETMEYGPAPEAAAPGLEWIQAHQPFGLFINNSWTTPASGQYLESINPASGKALARVAA